MQLPGQNIRAAVSRLYRSGANAIEKHRRLSTFTLIQWRSRDVVLKPKRAFRCPLLTAANPAFNLLCNPGKVISNCLQLGLPSAARPRLGATKMSKAASAKRIQKELAGKRQAVQERWFSQP
jgi:hypothetical protein